MIGYIKGEFSVLTPTYVYVEAAGVGYELNISLQTYEAIAQKKSGLLFTYLQIKEDAHTLYGFADRAEKDIFLLLISVSGVGAATARMMLSSLTTKEVLSALINGQVKVLEGVKGIGKKTAERLVLELREKAMKIGIGESLQIIDNNGLIEQKDGQLINDAVQALISLGIARNLAENAVKKAVSSGEITDVQTLIKKSLQLI